MARGNTIKFQLKQALADKASYGRSKHEDKVSTYEKREALRQAGASFEERMAVNDMQQHIYSYGTMTAYQQQTGYFGDWLIENGHKKISLEESREYIQEYIDHLEEQGKSAWTINLALAAICKATDAHMRDYHHPSRKVADVQRGKGERVNDALNDRKAAQILEANRLLGLRRSELKSLRCCDIFERDNTVVVQTVGKGGRHNEQIFTDPAEKQAVLALKQGRNGEERIFPHEDFKNDADLHHQRQLRAVEVYERVVQDMKEHPERRDYYKEQIYQKYHERNRTCRENLDNPYCVRGENRQRLLAEGREVTYDRVALLYVSTHVLSHTRSDTTAQFYVAK